MLIPKLVFFSLLVAAACSVPLPQRVVNEEDTGKFFRPTDAHRRTIDPKRADSADWMRIAEEDMKKADEMFGGHKQRPKFETSTSEVVIDYHKSDAVAPANEIAVDAPNAKSSPSQEPSLQQQLPEGDPVEHADPDHLPAVPLEGDGTLNAGYKAEILLGPEHSSAHDSPDEQRELLKHIFKRIDNNTDSYVDIDELTQWFLINVRRHMAAAQSEGEAEFKRLDVNKDNKLEWQEYESAHLRAVLAGGKDDSLITKKASSRVNFAHGEMEGRHNKNSEGHEDHLAALRLRWMRADDNGDDKLTLSEFSSFHHPEQHPAQLDALSKQLMASFDLNNDGKIEAWEFEAHTDRLPEEIRAKGPGSVMQYTNDLIAERKHQFQLADVDEDGYLTLDEVNKFIDPQNIQHAKHEAEDIVKLADIDEDDRLSLEEMLEKAAELMGPGRRLCDPAEALHDTDEL